jgi:cation-transporting ATPase I
VSGFFGCTPLGPVGWAIAAGATTTATAAGAVLHRFV